MLSIILFFALTSQTTVWDHVLKWVVKRSGTYFRGDVATS